MNAIIKNTYNRTSRDFVEGRKLLVRVPASFVKLSNLFCLLESKLRLALYPASLFNHVLGVVLGRAKKEVIGVHAVPNIAFMANKESFRDGAVKKLPGVSTGCMFGRIVSTVFIGRKHSVSISGHGAIPYPTRIGSLFVNLVNESLESIFAFHCHAAIMPHGNGKVNS